MSILDRKCAEENCWHFRAPGLAYCICCLNGPCATFSPEQQVEYVRLDRERRLTESNMRS